MAEGQIRFEDGAAYERMMGVWSRLAGEIFLEWLAPPAGLRWIDVGCGSGAFSELIVERAAPAEVQGIDPSEAQLAFARSRPAARVAQFRQGDAMALPFSDESFDAAVMALVIFFVPNPSKGLAEMVRVVRHGGHRRLVHVGHLARRLSKRAAHGGDERDWTCAAAASERGRVADGSAEGVVDGGWHRRH